MFHSHIKLPDLIGRLEHVFSHILGMSSSHLTFIFFRGVGQPPTSDGFGGISRLFYGDFMEMYWNLLVIIGSLW